jgi:hypothetical protein
MAIAHANKPSAPIADKQSRKPSVPPSAPRAPLMALDVEAAATGARGAAMYGRDPTGLTVFGYYRTSFDNAKSDGLPRAIRSWRKRSSSGICHISL